MFARELRLPQIQRNAIRSYVYWFKRGLFVFERGIVSLREFGSLCAKVLFVVAHPDDETLGAGATIRKFVDNGATVDLCVMSSKVAARTRRPSDDELGEDFKKAAKILGFRSFFLGDFPNIKMNVVPCLDLVQFVEKAILESQPEIVVTHSPSDLNDDHVRTSVACQTAARIFQRRDDVAPLRELWFMETPSSTEWALNSAENRFRPNLFVEIGKARLETKLEALKVYRGVMRPYPHPRSEEAVAGLAAYRGAQAGCDYAEAFECVFRRS